MIMKNPGFFLTRTQLIGFIAFIVFTTVVFADNQQELDRMDCLIKPDMFVELSSPVDGVLESIQVGKSDLVQKGQVIAQLNAAVEQASVDLARQRTKRGSDIRAKRIQLEFAKRKRNRLQALFQKEAASSFEKDEAETDVALAKEKLNQAIVAKKVANMELRLRQVELEQKTIKSPITGIVTDQFLMPGERVDDRAILKLAQVDPLKVEVIAPTDLFGKITPGMAAEIEPESPADQMYKATVSVVDRVIDAASGSFAIHLTLPNPEYKLVGGLRCKVKFIADSRPSDALSEPVASDAVGGFENSAVKSVGFQPTDTSAGSLF